jgi:hypothetical protein
MLLKEKKIVPALLAWQLPVFLDFVAQLIWEQEQFTVSMTRCAIFSPTTDTST